MTESQDLYGIIEADIVNTARIKMKKIERKLHRKAYAKGADQGANAGLAAEEYADQKNCAQNHRIHSAYGNLSQMLSDSNEHRISGTAAQAC